MENDPSVEVAKISAKQAILVALITGAAGIVAGYIANKPPPVPTPEPTCLEKIQVKKVLLAMEDIMTAYVELDRRAEYRQPPNTDFSPQELLQDARDNLDESGVLSTTVLDAALRQISSASDSDPSGAIRITLDEAIQKTFLQDLEAYDCANPRR